MIHTIDKQAEESAKILISYSTFKSIGFVLHGTSACEQAFFLIKQGNDFLQKNYTTNLCVFSMNRELPILQPNFAIFNTMDLQNFYGRLVATDIPTWQAACNSPSKEKYLYIYDIKRLHQVPTELIQKINESQFKIIARTKNHALYLKTMGFQNIIDTVIERFEIQKFMELVW